MFEDKMYMINILVYRILLMKYLLCEVEHPVNCPCRETYKHDGTPFSVCSKKTQLNCKCCSCNDRYVFPKDCPLISINDQPDSPVRKLHKDQLFLVNPVEAE